jgi:hypothetical protein
MINPQDIADAIIKKLTPKEEAVDEAGDENLDLLLEGEDMDVAPEETAVEAHMLSLDGVEDLIERIKAKHL